MAMSASAPTASSQLKSGIEGTPGKCTGKFVNPLTDVCWSCMFPLSVGGRPEEDTSELQSLMRISCSVARLRKKRHRARRMKQETTSLQNTRPLDRKRHQH